MRLRIEFNQTHLEYYTELDAVILYGLESEDEYTEEKDKDKDENKKESNDNNREVKNKNLEEMNETKLAKLLASQMTTNHHETELSENCCYDKTMDGAIHILALPVSLT